MPIVDSVIVHSETGLIIPVFDWAVKKFSDYGVNDGFKEKYRSALQIIEQQSHTK